jgi:hypothetical protein
MAVTWLNVFSKRSHNCLVNHGVQAAPNDVSERLALLFCIDLSPEELLEATKKHLKRKRRVVAPEEWVLILECPDLKISCLEVGWFRALQNFLCSINAERHLEMEHVPQILCKNNHALMEHSLHSNSTLGKTCTN